MKPTIEDLLDSARGLYPHAEVQGSIVVAFKKWPDPDDDGGIQIWNPPENAKQNWKCMEELWGRRCEIRFSYNWQYVTKPEPELCGFASIHRSDFGVPYNIGIRFYCDPKDFAYRALAELVRREK